MKARDNKLPLFPELDCAGQQNFSHYEELAASCGYKHIAGIDEAGRGPLAGPVVAAAVILGGGANLGEFTDSKAMTAKARESAFERLTQGGVWIGIGVASPKEIDQENILRATLKAMERAIKNLPVEPDFLLVDGITPVPVEIPQRCVIKGDRLCRNISAASVIAKVYRDRIMRAYHEKYPEYGFFSNKGYGTKEHMEALRRFGPCPIHRLTFKGVC